MRHRITKKEYAVKYIKDFTKHEALSLATLREVIILRKLTQMSSANVFTTKLHDIIIAGDKSNFKSIFLVMDYMPGDLRNLMTNTALMFDEGHAIIILYNILCSISFLHSANVIHRDLKPANILVNSTCEIRICDFGLSREFNSHNKYNQDR